MAGHPAASHGTAVNSVAQALRRSGRIFLAVGIFSGLINLLALTGSFYMLQVYDRVLPSRSVPTLVGLTVLMFGLYAANGLLDLFRTRLMSRIGVRIDNELGPKVFAAVQMLPLRARPTGDGQLPVRDLDQIRNFMSGMGPTALFDLPWMPIYLAVIFLFHPWLGWFAVVGSVLLIALTWLTEIRSKGPVKAASQSGSERNAFGEAVRRNAEVVRAMGLGPRMTERWIALSTRHLADQLRATDAAGGIGTVTKVLRLVLQSGILGLGAYLVVINQVSPGTIIAASIVMSRALAPVETAIANWRGFVGARQSYHRLSELVLQLGNLDQEIVTLPRPERSLSVQNLVVAPPGAGKPVLQGVSFQVEAGSGLGVIGPSASGKSTLARAIAGVWLPMSHMSSIRLDGATLDQWTPEALGRHIGYLPQDIELFDGSIAENIARFDPDATSEAIIAAAQAAGVHDMIVQLPEGYQTRIGEGGMALSAGQRQRVALARALYGDPFLVILDEPNSNLDLAGDNALTHAIASIRRRGGIAVVIAHRPSALLAIDQVLALANGQMIAYGPKDEVLRKVLQQQPLPPGPAAQATAPAATTAGLKVVMDR